MSGDREFKQPALASWERLQAERDEWKARAEKAEAELTDAQWERESLREKANGLEVERADAVRDLTRMLDNGAQTLAMVRASRREVSAERERLQEQVEQARADEARELDPEADHQLKVEFGDGQFWVTLLCPESGCIPAWDAPDGGDECWLKGWAEASVIDEGLVGEVIVAVSTSWDGDGPVSKIVADAQLVEWRERTQKAEAERDEARKLLDELCEIDERDEWKQRAEWLERERDRLQEQVEQAREILHDLFTNAAIDGRNNWQPVEAFLRAYPVAARSGSPDTETT